MRVELDVGTASGLGNYTPGDALGLFAPNDTEVCELPMQLDEGLSVRTHTSPVQHREHLRAALI